MKNNELMISFGPVPSRRLGQSIGINNIPPKNCTYSCIYCQLGRTTNIQTKRQTFYKPQKIFESVKNKIKKAEEKGESIDYITFVPDGEPTLDINLGKEIEMLKSLNFKIAVITNSSLLWKKEVIEELSYADYVSLKIDTINNKIWNMINRPHRLLKIDKILSGLTEFSQIFDAELSTETMLIKDINNNSQELDAIANFIKNINPKKSFISIPIRPPAEKFVTCPREFDINMAYNILKKKGLDAELLTDYEKNSFAFTGDAEKDLLSILSVHPMREDSLTSFLLKAKSSWHVIEKLIDEDKLVVVEYKDKKFYLRKLQK